MTNANPVPGLGNIGLLAAKPMIEGKGLLFKKFAGIDVFGITPKVALLSSSNFGGVLTPAATVRRNVWQGICNPGSRRDGFVKHHAAEFTRG